MQDNKAIKNMQASRLQMLNAAYDDTRKLSCELIEGLSEADVCVQSMPDASPSKWHLAHTTWFFETFILKEADPSYKVFDARYNFLFNSYYETVGKRHARPNRGMLTRPALSDILDYRKYVDAAMVKFTAQQPDAKWQTLLELGVHHEQQHQELLLTDILHLFAQNPIKPEYRKPAPALAKTSSPAPLTWKTYQGGVAEAGHNGDGFYFDCEGPRHKVYLNGYAMATRLVTVREYLEFMKDGGYKNPALWLSDGWATVKKEGWDAPLYWEEQDGHWSTMSLQGFRPVEMDAPVTNVSFYEAQAFAAWANCRLPTEFEWENAASFEPAGDFTNSKLLRPAPASANPTGALQQMYGDVWQWTSSSFMPYPGFKPAEGAVGEYNGKFMGSQYVLRGGSCATPSNHTRSTYRNFFYPHQRWQFTGLRLAKDVS